MLVDLHRGDAAQVARPDPRFDGRKAPSVRRGWIADRIDGKPMVAVEILMSRDELKTLIDELTQLQQAASGTARDLSELLQIGTAAASGETSFLAADRGSRTFADHLRRRQGLPPARPGSLLARSQSDLLRSDDLTLAALDARLRESLLQLTQTAPGPRLEGPATDHRRHGPRPVRGDRFLIGSGRVESSSACRLRRIPVASRSHVRSNLSQGAQPCRTSKTRSKTGSRRLKDGAVHAANKAEEGVEKAGHKIKEGATAAGNKVKEAGQKIKDAGHKAD